MGMWDIPTADIFACSIITTEFGGYYEVTKLEFTHTKTNEEGEACYLITYFEQDT